jgi:D-alanyl-D-alanine dipeptidase
MAIFLKNLMKVLLLRICPGLIGTILLTVISCKAEPERPAQKVQEPVQIKSPDTVDYDTTQWMELTREDGFIIDIRYATEDNFVKEKIYPCGRCFVRPATARKLLYINDFMHKKGFRLKLYDCYRPFPAQQKLWEKVPDPRYVAPPSEGSMHNRGVAVDITLVQLNGQAMDLGTEYDYFGPEAHHNYKFLPPEVLVLRKFLKTTMETMGFQSISTEWWHYSLADSFPPLADWQWPCPDEF